LRLKIKNISPMTQLIHAPVYLLGEDESPIQQFHIKEDKSLADFPKEGIPLKPNEVMEITFDSAMGSLNAHATSDGATALLSAANQGKARLVKLLIDKGADVNASSTINHAVWTPLKLAKQRRFKQIVGMLQKAGDLGI